MPLGATLYRQILRVARRHDAQPQLKACLADPRAEAARGIALGDALRAAIAKGQEIRAAAAAAASTPPTPAASSSSSAAPTPPTERTPSTKAAKASSSSRVHDTSGLHLDESGGSVLASTVREMATESWRKNTSPRVQRCIEAIFRNKEYYWPEVNFERLARNEFRLAVRETQHDAQRRHKASHTTTHAHPPAHPSTHSPGHASSATSAASSSATAASASAAPAAPAASAMTDAFSMLRTLNANLAEHKELHLTRAEMDVDPALEAYVELLVRLKTGAPMASLRDMLAFFVSGFKSDHMAHVFAGNAPLPHPMHSKVTLEAHLAWPKSDLMHATTELEAGSFLVAHPRMSSPFHHAVILLHRHDASGSAGVIINDPDAVVVRWVDDDKKTHPLKCNRGGPVGHLGSPPCIFAFLHSMPELAPVSKPVITGAHPVWIVDTASTAAPILEMGLLHGDRNAPGSKLEHTSRFFVGVSTWAPGQLASEIETGSWALMKGSGRHVLAPFGPPTPSEATTKLLDEGAIPLQMEHLWGHAMFQLGGEHRAFARIPLDLGKETEENEDETK